MATLPLLTTRIICPIDVLFDIRRSHPFTPILLERLNARPELRLMQLKVVNSAYARYAHTRKATAAPIHECSTNAAETIFHVVTRCNGAVLAETGELVFTAQMLQMSILDNEVGGKHAIG